MEAYELLEAEFSEFTGLPNMVACSSGTAALHLAFEALGLRPGGQVIVPEFCMVACARAVVMAGLRPVFVDCNDRLLIDPALIPDAITSDTVAILAVHVYGRGCDMAAIREIADRHGLKIVEDCAEYHGGPLHSPRSDAHCWSFYRNKIVAGEEGGAVAFRRPDCADLARQLRCQGFTAAHDFSHVPRGHNYRLSNANAELIRESLRDAKKNIASRMLMELQYERAFEDFGTLAIALMPPRDVCWVYDIQTDGKAQPLAARLNADGINARPSFKPMSSQPEFRGHYRHLAAHRASESVLYLPVSPKMDRADVARVVAAFSRHLDELCALPAE